MNYTLHQLQIFVQVVKTQNITKAAHELHMTQPAVSIQLKNLQNQFDIPLTETIGKQLYITDFGQEVAEMAKDVLDNIEAINYKALAYRGMLTGRLRISTASTGKYLIPYFLSGFLRKHPGIDLILDVNNRTSVVESLKNNQIDLALVSIIPEEVEVEEEIILENRLYFVGGTNKRIDNMPLIYREEGSLTRFFMEEYFQKIENNNRKRIELTSNEAVKQAVIAGLGYSILPLIGIRNELVNKQLYVLPLAELPIRTDWRLIWLKKKKLSRVTKAYLDFIQTEKHRILEMNFKWYLEHD